MSQALEIIGTYKGERFRFANANGDVIIGEVYCNGDMNGLVSIKGQADEDELQIDQTYRFYGKWAPYKNKRTGKTEQQFAFQSFVQQTPATREGVISYLCQHGGGHNFGKARAVSLYERFGADAVKVAREQPEEVVRYLNSRKLKFSIEDAQQLAASLIEAQATEGCTLDLIDLLKGRGFYKTLPRLIVKKWGNRGAEIIRRDPFKLMGLTGCGFKRCDAMYLDLQLDPGRLKRQALCAEYSVTSNNDGHTWFPADMAVKYVGTNISAAKADPQRAIRCAIRAKRLAEAFTVSATGPIDPAGRIRWLADHVTAQQETELAKMIADAANEPCIWPDVATINDISDHQRERLALALKGPIGILGGGPGTGKTYTLAKLVEQLIDIVGEDSILIGAPTGKAAVRVTENLENYGIPLRARTEHSHLASIEKLGPLAKFHHKIILIDETSMNDLALMWRIFKRRNYGCHVLLVGDVNQLPPVGSGAPLRDMILAGLPCGQLEEIKRNSGGIVEACDSIRRDQPWEAGDNLIGCEASTTDGQITAMLETIKSARKQGFDPVWDCQVVVAVNKRSPLARSEINTILQNELNHRPGVPGCKFRIGDKIVNTKNDYFPSVNYESDEELQVNERGDVYVANGELAEVIEVQEKLIVAKLNSPSRTIKIPFGQTSESTSDDDAPSTGCSWDLGYALSVHKSQGSEWPIVITMLDESMGAKMVCDRAWLYTAISRAKQTCYLVGKKSVADRFCRTNKMHQRKTLLKERILLESATNQLGEL